MEQKLFLVEERLAQGGGELDIVCEDLFK